MALLSLVTANSPSSAAGGPECRAAVLMDQQRNAATIIRLEHAWSVAYLRGDTTLERCLLTPDFTEVMRSGEVKRLVDELDLAAKNIGQQTAIPALPTPTVLVHGEAAVAFAKVVGKAGAVLYADFYVWTDGAWRVYFAQQTPA